MKKLISIFLMLLLIFYEESSGVFINEEEISVWFTKDDDYEEIISFI